MEPAGTKYNSEHLAELENGIGPFQTYTTGEVRGFSGRNNHVLFEIRGINPEHGIL